MKVDVFFAFDRWCGFGSKPFLVDIFADITNEVLVVCFIATHQIVAYVFEFGFVEATDIVIGIGNSETVKRHAVSSIDELIALFVANFQSHCPYEDEVVVFEFIELVEGDFFDFDKLIGIRKGDIGRLIADEVHQCDTGGGDVFSPYEITCYYYKEQGNDG